MTFGSIAVDVFFIISGFLVTGSLVSKQSVRVFIRSRVLRIYPGLIGATVTSVVLLGVFFTKSPLTHFLANQQTIKFLAKNITVVAGLEWWLPGVFEQVPYKGVINGSLWTLPWELRMYAVLSVIWLIACIAGKHRDRVLKWTVVGIASVAAIGAIIASSGFIPSTTLALARVIPQADSHAFSYGHLYLRWPLTFFSGAAFYVLRDHIVLSGSVFITFVAAILASTISHGFFMACYVLFLPYVVLYLAYIPSGWIRSFNNCGDYSYGMYIYAFPVQQAIAATTPGVHVLPMLLLSFVITLFFAGLSWNLIEKPALRLKNKVSPVLVMDCSRVGA